MVAPEASGFDNFVTAPLNFKRFGSSCLRSGTRELDCRRTFSDIVLPLYLLILQIHEKDRAFWLPHTQAAREFTRLQIMYVAANVHKY